jgi:hypothetical protein
LTTLTTIRKAKKEKRRKREGRTDFKRSIETGNFGKVLRQHFVQKTARCLGCEFYDTKINEKSFLIL